MIPVMDKKSREFLDHIKGLAACTLPPSASAGAKPTPPTRDIWKSPLLERLKKEDAEKSAQIPSNSGGGESIPKGLWKHFLYVAMKRREWLYSILAFVIAMTLLFGYKSVHADELPAKAGCIQWKKGMTAVILTPGTCAESQVRTTPRQQPREPDLVFLIRIPKEELSRHRIVVEATGKCRIAAGNIERQCGTEPVQTIAIRPQMMDYMIELIQLLQVENNGDKVRISFE